LQTFLPYPDFARSASVLDRQRLGKQRLEALHLLRKLRGLAHGPGWTNHPALRMWRGHEEALAEYGMAICAEWRARGYVDNLLPEFVRLRGDAPATLPAWFGDERLHASHRSNLLRKFPEWYSQFGWREGPELPYWWPVGPVAQPAEAPEEAQDDLPPAGRAGRGSRPRAQGTTAASPARRVRASGAGSAGATTAARTRRRRP